MRFVSVLSRSPRSAPPLPLSLPEGDAWLLRILGHESRFVFGVYRRRMKAIGKIDEIDRLFGSPATTRGWNTILRVARALEPGRS